MTSRSDAQRTGEVLSVGDQLRALTKRLPTMPETRWLYEVVIAAVAYRDATRAAISKVRLHPDTERAYDRAAAKLDGALNELRLARRGEVRGTVTDTKGLRK